MPGVPEPVPKAHQALYVKAAQDLHWLSEHDMLDQVALFLSSLRAAVEEEDRLTPGKFQARYESTVTPGGETRTWTSADGRVQVRAHLSYSNAEALEPVAMTLTLVEVFEDGQLVLDKYQAQELAKQAGLMSYV